MGIVLQIPPKNATIDIRKEQLMPKSAEKTYSFDMSGRTYAEILATVDEAYEQSKHEPGRPAREFFAELEAKYGLWKDIQ